LRNYGDPSITKLAEGNFDFYGGAGCSGLLLAGTLGLEPQAAAAPFWFEPYRRQVARAQRAEQLV